MTKTLWVFGYGSLIWDPGFQPTEQIPATLAGWTRRFCLCSLRYRGTKEDPGLVLALDADPTSFCTGVALAVPKDEEKKVLKDLRARELFNPAYREITMTLSLQDGRDVDAMTYVVNRSHEQYCDFDLETQARIIATAKGERGPNHEYLINTADRLRDLGIADPAMDHIANRVRFLRQGLATV